MGESVCDLAMDFEEGASLPSVLEVAMTPLRAIAYVSYKSSPEKNLTKQRAISLLAESPDPQNLPSATVHDEAAALVQQSLDCFETGGCLADAGKIP